MDPDRAPYSPLLDRALAYAARAHADQTRKGREQGDLPYLVHPVQVAWILQRAGYPDEVAAAALLHDVIEDTEGTADDLRAEFGKEVARLVVAVSEKKLDASGEKRPWRIRKREQIEHLEETDDDRVVALKAADSLHNLKGLLRDLDAHGEEAWEGFSAPDPPRDYTCRYGELARIVREHLGSSSPLARELESATSALAARTGETLPPE